MDLITCLISIIGIIGTISSIYFAFLAFKRTSKEDQKALGKSEGKMISDIGYIKECVERVEKNLQKTDEQYQKVVERTAKLEEAMVSVTKRVDDIYKQEGG